jgi:hypothetical protein
MGFLVLCAGIRVLFMVLLALPLCGAALTFFAAAKKVSKESGLTPLARVITHGPPMAPSCTRQRFGIARCPRFE